MGKVTAEEAAEEQRRRGIVDDLQKHADSVVIQPGDYQIHVHVIMVWGQAHTCPSFPLGRS